MAINAAGPCLPGRRAYMTVDMTEHRHSMVPLEHGTQGLDATQLRGLAERHGVRFEVGPHQISRGAGEIVRHGWVVDLYGARSANDRGLQSDEATHHVHDVLDAIARHVVPRDAGQIAFELEPYTGAVHLDPRRDFLEEVRLRILIEPETTARESVIGDTDTQWMSDVSDRLEELGCVRRG